jgi:N-acetyl-beta-hexosaminidase
VPYTHTIPATIPALREWVGGQDNCVLTPSSRLIVGTGDLMPVAQTVQKDLQRLVAHALPVVSGGEPEDGDIFLTLIGADTTLGSQGYSLDITSHVKIRANTASGVFYGLQTVGQLLQQDPAHCYLPGGMGQDYPAFAQRGLMLDVGRKYWSVDYLKALMRTMAWLKLNVLHLHFNDWSAFRLRSERYPGLAAELSYSQTDLAELQATANQYHITLVPEIDLPAHATVITRYNPALAFACDCMSRSRWPGGESGGWTINYADPAARQWMKDLLHEFIPLLDSPYFHIGCDEVPERDKLAECPELAAYARTQGYPHPGDVLVEWINQVNELVKSYGKQTQIWNWWERSPHSIEPARDIIINVWANRGTAERLLQAGYQVINSPEDTHYVTPGLALSPEREYLYQTWDLDIHPNMLGYKICVWADKVEDKPEAFFEDHLRQPRAILAERTWTGDAPIKPLPAFLDLLDTLLKD